MASLNDCIRPINHAVVCTSLTNGLWQGMLDSNHHARWLCHCAGLPEEKAIVKAVVQRKYAVVAFSSMDRGGSRCWSLDASTNSSDLSKVPSSANLRSITYLQTNHPRPWRGPEPPYSYPSHASNVTKPCYLKAHRADPHFNHGDTTIQLINPWFC